MNYPGYTLVRREDCPEQHGALTVLNHDVSGATVLLVENEDTNKAYHSVEFFPFPGIRSGNSIIREYPGKFPIGILFDKCRVMLNLRFITCGLLITVRRDTAVSSHTDLLSFIVFPSNPHTRSGRDNGNLRVSNHLPHI